MVHTGREMFAQIKSITGGEDRPNMPICVGESVITSDEGKVEAIAHNLEMTMLHRVPKNQWISRIIDQVNYIKGTVDYTKDQENTVTPSELLIVREKLQQKMG